MRKISLDVNALKVESFDTARKGADERGTVHGRELTREWEPSCYVSCTSIADCLCISELRPDRCLA